MGQGSEIVEVGATDDGHQAVSCLLANIMMLGGIVRRPDPDDVDRRLQRRPGTYVTPLADCLLLLELGFHLDVFEAEERWHDAVLRSGRASVPEEEWTGAHDALWTGDEVARRRAVIEEYRARVAGEFRNQVHVVGEWPTLADLARFQAEGKWTDVRLGGWCSPPDGTPALVFPMPEGMPSVYELIARPDGTQWSHLDSTFEREWLPRHTRAIWAP